MKASDSVALPFNLPSKKYGEYPSAQVGYIQNQLHPRIRIDEVNYFNPNSLFWGKDDTSIYMPYLPYFSNCQVNIKQIRQSNN